MPAKKARLYGKGQFVEIGQGKRRKPLVGEIVDLNISYHYTRARGRSGSERQVSSRIIQYKIHYLDGTFNWVYQEQILRAQKDLTQEQLEARTREMFGEDYL